MNPICRTVPGVLAAVILFAGCSSSSGGKAPTTSPKSTPSSYEPAVGADAAIIAGHIPNCENVTASAVGGGGPALASTATCTLLGHLLIVDSWSSASDATINPELLSGVKLTYASGAGWCAFLADDGATAAQTTLQMQLTNDAGGLTREGADGDKYAPPSADVQQQVATVVARALGGTVIHV